MKDFFSKAFADHPDFVKDIKAKENITMDNKQWFRDAKFGMMVHFGLYSILLGEWKGICSNDLAEWAQCNYKIPCKEYHELAKIFNPIYFNADEWISLAKEAGMKYFVITAKHHEGFALFKSKASSFNVVDATPFGRDIIGELAESCYKYGLKMGLYYSQEVDWSHPHGGGWGETRYKDVGTVTWTNDWDFPDNSKKDYSICFREKTLPQVTELLTNYGDIGLIWFDTPNQITNEQSLELYNAVKRLQPNCLVNSRIGNKMGDYESAGDNVIPDKTADHLFEAPCTINDTWGFKACDQNWKSPERILEIKKHLNDRGINYLLNVGPDHLGRIPSRSVQVLREVGRLDGVGM